MSYIVVLMYYLSDMSISHAYKFSQDTYFTIALWVKIFI